MSTMNNFNLLVSMTRSHDIYHTKNNITHLVVSGLYLGTLPSLEDMNVASVSFAGKQKLVIIKVTRDFKNDISLDLIHDTGNFIYHEYSLAHILNHSGFSNKFANTLVSLFGDCYQQEKDKTRKQNSIYNKKSLYNFDQGNVIFIFEDIQYHCLKHIFNRFNITISGGSVNRRHMLSVTQTNLFKNILMLGIKYKDILTGIDDNLLRNKVYKELQINSNNCNDKFITKLFYQTLIELLGSILEIDILVSFVEKDIKELESGVSRSYKDDGIVNSYKSNEDKKIKYENLIRELYDISIEYLKYFNYIRQTWLDINNPFNFDEEALRDSDFTSFFNRAQILGLNNWDTFVKILMYVYPYMYERRKIVQFDSNYYNCINLILSQKLLSPKGDGFDFTSILEKHNIFNKDSKKNKS